MWRYNWARGLKTRLELLACGGMNRRLRGSAFRRAGGTVDSIPKLAPDIFRLVDDVFPNSPGNGQWRT